MRVFGVDYQFLSCGNVFTQGLVNAAASLGIAYEHAGWDDSILEARIRAFKPDLLFVVHGRRFSQRFPDLKPFACKTAIWLLDEPYEVDDTMTFSSRFDYVFVNDPATLHRHKRATYLPVCYDPVLHHPIEAGAKANQVGFVGGGNNRRERVLSELARAGFLSYVVGGYWADPAINQVCISANVKPSVTALLYSSTRIVVNVFREQHHYNATGIQATSMNPRIYEALACGALVISEPRNEIARRVPDMPTFRSEAECVAMVRSLLSQQNAAESIRQRCASALQYETYEARLATVVDTVSAEVAA